MELGEGEGPLAVVGLLPWLVLALVFFLTLLDSFHFPPPQMAAPFLRLPLMGIYLALVRRVMVPLALPVRGVAHSLPTDTCTQKLCTIMKVAEKGSG